MGDLGIPIPEELSEILSERSEESPANPEVPDVIQNEAIITEGVAQAVIRPTLGEEGQRLSLETLEEITEFADDATGLTQNADDITTEDEKTAKEADRTANQSDRTGDRSVDRAETLRSLASEAQGMESSQDVLKVLARLSAGSGTIMASISEQLGGNSSQLGDLSSQLASNSQQNTNMTELGAMQVQMAATQTASLETLKQQGAAGILLEKQSFETLQGMRQAEVIRHQAEFNGLMNINQGGFRIMK